MPAKRAEWNSRLTSLQCTGCGASHEPRLMSTCTCGRPLVARYDLGGLGRDDLLDRGDLWRYAPLLPLKDEENLIGMGEGGTPLRHCRKLGHAVGVSNLYVKVDGANPTGTFKARGMSVALSKAKELGVDRVAVATTGSAGSAIAAYAKKGGMRAFVAFARGASEHHVRIARELGAEVRLCRGWMDEAIAVVDDLCRDGGYFNIATMKEPYRLEGKKTIALEVVEGLGRFPDVMVFPVGGGMGYVAAWKALRELRELGWYEGDMRLLMVQPEGCAPFVRAVHEGTKRGSSWEDVTTRVSGLAVPQSFADEMILTAARETNGEGVAVSDTEIFAAVADLERMEGISSCPEGAASLAGTRRFVEDGIIGPDETVVAINTGVATPNNHKVMGLGP